LGNFIKHKRLLLETRDNTLHLNHYKQLRCVQQIATISCSRLWCHSASNMSTTRRYTV